MSVTLIQHKEQILRSFKCQQTGHCCRAPGYVYVSQQEIIQMSAKLNVSIDQFRAHFVTTKNGWDLIATPEYRQDCFLNDHNCCDIYDARPKYCSSYPDWPDIWVDDNALINESKLCKGLELAIQTITE